jgi:hypothetical protein
MVSVFQSLHASASRVSLLSYDTFSRRWRRCCKYKCNQYLNSIVLLTSKLGVRYIASTAGGTNNQFHRTAESDCDSSGAFLELKTVSGYRNDPGPCGYVVDKIALGQILLKPLSSTILQILHTNFSTIGRLDRQVTGCNATHTYTSQPIRKFKNNTRIGRPMPFVSVYLQNRHISQLLFPFVFKAG